MELSGTTLGTGYDHITDTASLTLGGVLNVSLISGFTPAASQLFDLLDFNPAQTTGTFSAIQLPTLATGLMWNASQLYTTGTISVNLLGDYNGNGAVDAADYVLYRHTLGQIGTALAADGNANGVIDSGDFDTWRANFGHANPASGSLAGRRCSRTLRLDAARRRRGNHRGVSQAITLKWLELVSIRNS